MPVAAFMTLYKYRKSLDKEIMKNYYLILYQGLRKGVFYWEMVNTVRKVLILAFNTILSILPIFFRIILCIVVMIAILRIQMHLNPYTLNYNNDIEMKAIMAGILTLYCGIIFEEQSDQSNEGFLT